MDAPPADAFLEGYPDAIREQANELRALVRRAVPGVAEGVRLGWHLIGYDMPLRSRWRFFAYVAPEPIHVHLGFEYGAWMTDPNGVLEGAHLRLKKVRYLTFRPGEMIPRSQVIELIREGARAAGATSVERLSLELDRDAART